LFRTLKIAFKTALIYATDHPAFIKAVDDFYDKLEAVLATAPVLILRFTPHTIFTDDRFWDNNQTATELARLFHLRRIQSLEIRSGIPRIELRKFAALITQSIEDIIHQGGVQAIINKEGFGFLSVAELNYSELLKGEGEEIADLWSYLLLEAAETEDPEKMGILTQRLQNSGTFIDAEKLLQSDLAQKGMLKLFKFLKDSSENQYRVCGKNLIKSLVAGKKILPEANLEKLQELVADLDEEDLASTLWEEIVDVEDFNVMGLGVFSQIVSKDKQPGISTSLKDLLTADHSANRRPEVKEKILALLSETSDAYISPIYHQTLSTLLREMKFDEKQVFDRVGLERNYRYLLLNILDRDDNPDQMIQSLDKITQEWPRIAEAKDPVFLRDFLEVLRKKEPDLGAQSSFRNQVNTILVFIEDLIIKGDESSEFNDLIPQMRTGSRLRDTVLDRIFVARTVTPSLLKFLFQCLDGDFAPLKNRIDRASADGPLLESLAVVLETIDTQASFEMGKLFFAAGDMALKIKVLSCLGALTVFDETFLFSVLKSEDLQLKAGALLLLMRTERTRHVAFQSLFAIESPFGIKNRILFRHLQIVEKTKLREAEPYLRTLISRKGFWNKRLRRAGSRILEAWHEG